MVKAVIFDFDGVIHDTFEFHRDKIREFSGISLSKNDFRDIHNGNFFSNKNNDIKDINWLKYRDFIHPTQSILNITNDIKETIFSLSKDYNLFIVTSGGTKNISDYLHYNGLNGVFKDVLGLESFHSKVNKFKFIFKKYNLTPADCIFITDTLGDILEANELNIKTIAVDFGFHEKATLEKGRPFKIVSSAHELSDIIKAESNQRA